MSEPTKVHLMNSAMMPRGSKKGSKYVLWEIDENSFIQMVQQADKEGSLLSSIGYAQNIDWIYKATGVKVPLSRAVTKIQDGDDMLIMRLKYRAENKGSNVNTDDFEFFICNFSE